MSLEMSPMISLTMSLARDVTRYDTCNVTYDRKICHIYSSLTNPNDNTPNLKTDQIQQRRKKKRGQSKKLASKPSQSEEKIRNFHYSLN